MDSSNDEIRKRVLRDVRWVFLLSMTSTIPAYCVLGWYTQSSLAAWASVTLAATAGIFLLCYYGWPFLVAHPPERELRSMATWGIASVLVFGLLLADYAALRFVCGRSS